MNKQILVLREGFRILNAISPKTSAKFAEKIFLSIRKPNLTDKEKAFLRTARQYNVPFKGTHIVTYEWGQEDAPAVLLVHGWNSSAAAYIDLVPKLLSEGYRVISYDMVSHGFSPRYLAQITCWADAVRSVLRYYGKVDSIIGHSLGGAGILIASKLGLSTDKIILVAPCSDLVDISDRFAQMLNIPDNVIQMKRSSIWSKFEKTVERYGKDWIDIFSSKFKVPTLIIHDRNDEDLNPNNSVRIKRKWPWAKLEYTEKLGHQRILHDEMTLSRVVSFVMRTQTNDWSVENFNYHHAYSQYDESAQYKDQYREHKGKAYVASPDGFAH